MAPTALRRGFVGAAAFVVAATTTACKRESRRYDTEVEITSARALGARDGKAASVMELEMRFTACPGVVHRVMRGDKNFAACAAGVKKGDRLPAVIAFSYDAERENYVDELVRVGTCDVKLDPKEDANYETVEVCSDVVTTGVNVGVRCVRKREGEIVAKCPWLRRL